MKTIKTLLPILLLSIFLTGCVSTQKSASAFEYKYIKIPPARSALAVGDATSKVNSMTKDGWELIDSEIASGYDLDRGPTKRPEIMLVFRRLINN